MKVLEIWFKYPPEVSLRLFSVFCWSFLFCVTDMIHLCTIKKRTSAMKWNLLYHVVWFSKISFEDVERNENSFHELERPCFMVLKWWREQNPNQETPCWSYSISAVSRGAQCHVNQCPVLLFTFEGFMYSQISSVMQPYIWFYACICDVSVTNQHVRHSITITIKEAHI